MTLKRIKREICEGLERIRAAGVDVRNWNTVREAALADPQNPLHSYFENVRKAERKK